ncbi:MAG: sulfite exporter TauE/SafE family protein [Haliea sp.]|nr:MAG: sulfite exporter TauE/SafE family protein [Haliea sp.]
MTGRRFQPNPAALVTAGGLAGFFGTLTSIGAPPLVLVYQHQRPPVIRSTLSANVVLGSLASIVALGLNGQLGTADFTRSLAFAPACVAGLLLSTHVRDRIDRGALRPILLGISAAAAVGVLVREFMR